MTSAGKTPSSVHRHNSASWTALLVVTTVQLFGYVRHFRHSNDPLMPKQSQPRSSPTTIDLEIGRHEANNSEEIDASISKMSRPGVTKLQSRGTTNHFLGRKPLYRYTNLSRKYEQPNDIGCDDYASCFMAGERSRMGCTEKKMVAATCSTRVVNTRQRGDGRHGKGSKRARGRVAAMRFKLR